MGYHRGEPEHEKFLRRTIMDPGLAHPKGFIETYISFANATKSWNQSFLLDSGEIYGVGFRRQKPEIRGNARELHRRELSQVSRNGRIKNVGSTSKRVIPCRIFQLSANSTQFSWRSMELSSIRGYGSRRCS